LKEIQATTLTVNQLEPLLLKASYFLCVPQDKMNEIKPQLKLTDQIDHDSEQLGLILFKSSGSLEIGKIFTNRIELIHLLGKSDIQFEVSSLHTLIKVSGLSKLGFVRS